MARPGQQLLLPFIDPPRHPAPAVGAPLPTSTSVLASTHPPLVLSPPEPAAGDPERSRRLEDELALLIGLPVQLRVHDNRSTMISFRRSPGAVQVRLHHMFLRAAPPVVRAVAEYARSGSNSASRLLDAFIRDNRNVITKPRQRRERLIDPLGAAHDLGRIYTDLNARYFGDGVVARIGWGRGTDTGRRRRTIRMGAYFPDSATILIHPALDRPAVPDYFVAFVVYHEMLHQAVPHTVDDGGRRCVHSREFRRRERLFHDYERARAWERRNLGTLLRPD